MKTERNNKRDLRTVARIIALYDTLGAPERGYLREMFWTMEQEESARKPSPQIVTEPAEA